MKDLTPKVTTNSLTAIEFNSPTDELENIVTETGQVLDVSGSGVNDPDTNQVGRGVAHYSATGQYYLDTGGINSYVLAHADSIQLPAAYSEGFTVRFIAANTSTGASTIAVGSLGSVSLLTNLGAALEQGSVTAGSFVIAHFDGVNFRLDFENFGLGDTVSGLQSTDLDLYIATGFFRAFFSAPNNPTLLFTPSEDGTVIAQSIDASNTTQLFTSLNSDRVFVRRQFIGVWEPWYSLAEAATTVTFTANGTYTPTRGLKSARVTVVAGGGGAVGGDDTADESGGAGGGGGTAIRSYTIAEIGANASLVVGAGGNGATPPASSVAGGNTSFNPAGPGITLLAIGGDRGLNLNAPGNGNGATTGANILSTRGQDGHSNATLGAGFTGGAGGSSSLGPGGGTANVNDNGKNGSIPGGGGGAGGFFNAGGNSAGGDGGDGVIIVEEFF